MVEREMEKNHFPGFLIGIKTEHSEECISYGTADPASKMGMEQDTIFRLYSMSKPICAVAVWILIERGKLSLDARLDEYLPEFRDMVRVQGNHTVPIGKPVTIRMLLNMTAGFSYDTDDLTGQKTGKVFEWIHHAMDAGTGISTREAVKLFAEIPLAFEPGERWRYGVCADILGAVIEAADGRKLGDFYREEIFEPLGMGDTGFFVPKEKQGRFAPLFKQVGKNGSCELSYDREHHLGLGDFLEPPAFESAGAGLVSTYQDYMKFAWMLANGGMGNGRRIVKADTVALFSQNQLTKEQTRGIYFEHMPGYGYGNLMRICLDGEHAPVPGEKGAFGWDGWCGPYMSVNKDKKKAVLFFVQISAYSNWKLSSEIFRLLL